MRTRRLVSILLALVMVAGLIPAAAVTATASPMQIYIYYADVIGNTPINNVESSTTVGEVKAIIAGTDVLDCPSVEYQTLSFGGNVLSDDSLTLADYNIQNESVLTLTVTHTHTDANNQTITFEKWTRNDSLPDTAGNYYLVSDVTISGGSTWTVPSGTTNLCLYGHDIHLNAGVIRISSGRTLNLFDKAGNQGTITGGRGISTYDLGTCGGDIFDEGTLNMYGGTITGGSAANGGGIAVFGNGSFTMYGGEISGNTATTSDHEGVGGGVYGGDGATITLVSGSVTGNTADYGGGVAVWTGSGYSGLTLNLIGTAITNNTAIDGGGILNGFATLNLTGGTVSGNTVTTGCGAGLKSFHKSSGMDAYNNLSGTVFGENDVIAVSTHIADASAKPLNITGDLGSRVYKVRLYTNGRKKTTATTGVITSGLYGNGTLANFVSGSGAGYALTLNASGEAEFAVGKSDPIANAPTGLTATVGQRLSEVYIPNPSGNTPGIWTWNSASSPVGEVGSHTFEAIFTPNDTSTYNSVHKYVTVTVAAPHTHTDANNQTITFDAWTATDSLPTSGSYYLTDDVTISQQSVVGSGNELNLCLNGHTVNANKSCRFYEVNGTLRIYDCDSGGGTLTAGSANYGASVKINSSGCFELYGGTIDCASVNYISVYNYGTFTMKGGTIKDAGGFGVQTDPNALFTMEGGTISGCKKGGVNVYGGNMVLKGGTITENGGTNQFGGILLFNYSGKTSALQLSGNPVIKNNYKDSAHTTPCNIQAYNGQKITINDTLTNTTPIGVTTSNPGVFTSGLSGRGDDSNFVSDNPSYAVTLTAGGEAQLVTVYTVTWKNYNGDVLETDSSVLAGTTPSYDGAEPTRAADAQNTYTFSGWTDGTNTYGLSSPLPGVSGNVTYTAVFTAVAKHIHDGVTFDAWTATDSLPETTGSYYLTDDVTLTDIAILSGTVNLCLNGHTVTNGYESTPSNPNPIIYVPAGTELNLYGEEGGSITSSGVYSIYTAGKATLKGGTVSGTQVVVAVAGNGELVIDGATVTGQYNTVSAGGDNVRITLESGTVRSTGASPNTAAFYINKGSLTVNGGTVDGAYIGIAVSNLGSAEIKGGDVSGTYFGINNSGALEISGGTVTGQFGVYNNGASATTEISGTADVTGTTYAVFNNKGTTDVTGGTVSYSGTAEAGQTIVGMEGTVNISGGTVSNNTAGGAAIYMNDTENGGTVNISGDAQITSSGFGVNVMENATMNMTGGSITSVNAAVSNHGDITAESTVNISGGTLTSTGADGIFHPGIGTVTVSGDASITGALSGIEMRAGTLNVNGGTITSTATEFSAHSATSGPTITGAGIAVSQHMTNLAITVHITDGELNGIYGIYEKDVQDPTQGEPVEIIIEDGLIHASGDGLAIDAYDVDNNDNEEVTVTISGGTYDTIFPLNYCAEGLMPSPNGDGTYGVEAIPECQVLMGSAADSSKIRADLYFVIPAVYDSSLFTVTVNDNGPVDLSTMDPEEDGYKFSFMVPAKNMGDKISYSLTYKGVVIKSGEVSVADYAGHLAEYYPDYADFAAAMLNYGAAAQVYFGYDTDNLVSSADLTALAPVVGDRLDSIAIREAMEADADLPVDYSAMSVTFVADTTLSIAFRVRDGVSDEDALAWVNANVTLGGAAVSGSVVDSIKNGVSDPSMKFVIISKQNVAISDINQPLSLAISGVGTYSVSVLNYLAAAEASGSANLRALARGLFTYAGEAMELLS